MKNNRVVVVLSRNYSTGLSVVRSLGEAGYTVDLVASAIREGRSAAIATSKYINNYVEVVSEKVQGEGDPELVKTLLGYYGKYENKPVLIATDDYTTSVMDLNKDVLKEIFVVPEIVGGAQGTLKRAMDKSVQGEIARSVGILTPEEWVISLKNEIITVPEEIIYPCYCKPLESSMGYKQEMAKCSDKDELLNHLYKLQERYSERSVLVQKFLDIDEEIDLEGICVDQKVVLPGIIWKRIVAKYDKGVPLAGKTFSIEELGEFKDKIIKMLQQFHYFGMFDIGFNIVGNQIYFNEINMRSGGTNFVYFKSGVNLPELFVKEAAGMEYDQSEAEIKEIGKEYFYEKVGWDDYLNGYMTKEELDECNENADITFMCNDKDPEPGQIFMEEMQRMEKRKLQREGYIAEVAEAAGWDHSFAEQQMKETLKLVGAGFGIYARNEFWKYSIEEQAKEFEKIMQQKEERNQKRESYINTVCEAAGWEFDYAQEQMTDCRNRTGITFREYAKYEFWKYAVAEQQQEYEKLKIKLEKWKKQKEECIALSVDAMGWDNEYAEQYLKNARSRVGISYKDYVKYEFWKFAEEHQEEEYKKIQCVKENEKNAKANISGSTDGTSVIVFSRSHTLGLGLIKALGAAGYEVDFIANSHRTGAYNVAASSKYVKDSVEIVTRKNIDINDNEIVDEFINRGKKLLQKAVILPADDYTAYFLDMNRETLSEYFILPSVANKENGSLTKLMSRIVQSELAKEAGFYVPKEWIVDLKNIELQEDLVYPCICKPVNVAIASNDEVSTCNDESELKRHLNKMRIKNDDRLVMIQEFLKVDRAISISGICYDQEVVIPGIVERTEVATFNETVSMAGIMREVEGLGEIIDNVKQLMSNLHYKGQFEFEINKAGDKYYFNEINLRCGNTNHAYLKCGANLPGLLVECLMNNGTVSYDFKMKFGKSFAYDNVVWGAYARDEITKREAKHYLAKVDFTMLEDRDDPKPKEVYMGAFNKRTAKKKVKKYIKTVIFPVLRPIKHMLLRYPQMKKENQRDPNSAKPRVIVSGRNYCSNLCISRALGLAGYEVEVLRIHHRKPKLRNLLKIIKPDAYSKFIKAYHVCVYGGKSRRVVNKFKSIADEDRKMLIVPADDLVACIVDDYYEELSEYFLLPNVNEKTGEINRLMSKSVQKELALQAGLPVVNSCVIKTEGGEFEIPDSVTYPCFIKPNISKNGSKTKMQKCESRDELMRAMTELCEKKDVEMLVEDFVEIARESSILGVSTKNGAIGPGFFVAEEGGQHEHRGVAITGKIMPCSERQQLIDDIVKFVGSLGYDGLYDVDLMEDVNGKMYFIELNMRFGGSGYAVTASGVNLPGMFADYMISEKSIDMNCKLENTGKRFVSEKVLIEEYIKSRITMSRVNQIMDDVDIHFIKDAEDAAPFRHFKRFYIVAALYRLVYKIKDSMENDFEK